MTEILEKNETKYNYFFWYHGHDSCYTDNSIPRVWYIIGHIDWEKSIAYILGIKDIITYIKSLHKLFKKISINLFFVKWQLWLTNVVQWECIILQCKKCILLFRKVTNWKRTGRAGSQEKEIWKKMFHLTTLKKGHTNSLVQCYWDAIS